MSASDDDVDGLIFRATADAYYGRVLAEADEARTRAQSAFSVASLIAGTLAAAGIFSDRLEASLPLAVLWSIAVIAWVASAVAFLWTVSAGHPTERDADSTTATFVDTVITRTRTSRDEVLDRLKIALWLTTLACVASTATLIGFLVVGAPSREVVVWLSPAGSARLASPCGAPRRIGGRVDAKELTAKRLVVTHVTGCRGALVKEVVLDASDITTLAVPPR